MSDENTAAGARGSGQGDRVPDEPNVVDGGQRRKRRWIAPVAIVAVLLVAGGFAVFALTSPQGDPEPSAAPSASPTESPTPTPTPIPTDEPNPEPTATPSEPAVASLPTECAQIYSPAMYAQLDKPGNPLNDPSIAGNGISRVEPVEAYRTSLEHLDCYWGVPTEGGVSSGVAALPSDAEQTEAVRVLQANGFDCAEEERGTRCTIVFGGGTGDGPEDPFGSGEWRIGETHFLGNGLWAASWGAGLVPPLDEYIDDLIDTLWPAS